MINIYAPINTLGYGIHATNIIKSLIKKDKDVVLCPIGQPAIPDGNEYISYINTAVKNTNLFDGSNPSLYIFHDTMSNQYQGKPRCTFSVFETSLIHERSKLYLNKACDIVMTTTKAHKALLIDNGVTESKIEVVNEGVDEEFFNTLPTEKYINTKKFTYITAGKCENRKNTDYIIANFIAAMQYKECALICHTYNPFAANAKDYSYLSNWTAVDPVKVGFNYKGFNGKYHLFSNGMCDIYFTAPVSTTRLVRSLYASANIGLQVSKGEGWDLVCIEMLACGIPTINSDCLGHSEYNRNGITDDLIIPVSSQEVADDGVWFKGTAGVWDLFDFDIFCDMLATTYEQQNQYLRPNEALAKFYHTNFSWSKSADTILKLV